MSAAAPRWVGLAMARLSGYWRELHPLPIARTLKSYSLGDFKRDVRAGSVVAALSIPQCMAYALIAGLPPQNGLYAAVAGGFLGALFGSSNHLVTEPSNATAIVLGSAFLQFHGQINPLTAVLTVTFLVGLFQLVAGMSKLGNLTQYVSRSVIIGYTSAAAILIATGQVHNLLGFDLHASSFYDLCVKTFTNLDQTQWGCLAWGLFGIAVMLGVRRWYPKFPTVLAFLLLSGVLVYFFHLDQLGGMALLDEVPAG
ncbi:MAG: SulP family inorganic anion transporter, partial [Verrucomicrobiae bacterium]|nr:SulP family inorganic anion transporter [Verrucomicrobiae bacterium]